VQESLSLVARGREEGRNRTVGESLSSLIRNATPDTRLTMAPPTLDERRRNSAAAREVRLESEGDVWRWSYGDTFISGVYDLKMGPPVDRLERYAVNLDPRECPLDRLDPAQLPQELAGSATQSTTSSSGTLLPGGTGLTYAWFRPLIIAVVVLLALESLMARWFGGGRA